MRVLILTQYYPPEIGAPQTRLAALARELRRLGHGVEVVTSMPCHLLGRVYDGYHRRPYMRETIDGIPVQRTWAYAATGSGLPRLLNYLSFTLTCIFGLIVARRADIVFVESPPLFLCVPGWIAARIHRAKLVFNVADLWPDVVRDLGLMRDGTLLRCAGALEAWAYRRADHINAVTEGIYATLRGPKGVSEAKMLFLPNGIDVDQFTPRAADSNLRRRLRLDGRPVFIYAGTHGIAQGLHTLIHAAVRLKDEAIVLFVGSGPTKPYLVQLAREKSVDNVRFCDMVPLGAMPEYFALAYASIVPLVRGDLMRGSRPSKLFPAFACGVPVIYSGEGEGAELVRGAGAGIVVEPENGEALADGMRELISRPAQRDEMGRAARMLVEQRFTWRSIVGKWLRELNREPAATPP